MGRGQNRSAAVMAQKARGEVAGDDDQVALWRKLEFFPTPPWAARAGAELVLRLDPPPPGCEPWWAWEPACGQGHMAAALRESFGPVLATDIHDHGWRGQDGAPLDFLSAEADGFGADAGDEIDWIITNPPFESAAEFVRLGLKRARRGVAVLQRLQWLGSGERYPLFCGATPLSVFAPFIERPAHHLGRWEPKGSTATDYAWFVWLNPPALVAAAQVDRGITATGAVLRPIPPGTRERLTRPDDARLWGALADAPLFEGME